MSINHRLISILFYFGLLPFFPFLLSKNIKTKKLSDEYRYALVVSFIQFITITLGLLIWIIGNQLVVQYSSFDTVFYNKKSLEYIYISIILIGIIIWFIYLIRCIFGFDISIPFISKISSKAKILKLAYFINTAMLILFILIIIITIYSNKLSSQNTLKPAKVYMLYDDMGFVPRWIFPLGFYQMQRVAKDKWGDGNVSIEPISHESLKEALSNASFIFLAVHGYGSYGEEYAGYFRFYNEARNEAYLYGPDQIKNIGIGKNLKFVYLSHCNGGILEKEWSEVFNPVKIKSFDRISTYPEHIYWLWIKLPSILKGII